MKAQQLSDLGNDGEGCTSGSTERIKMTSQRAASFWTDAGLLRAMPHTLLPFVSQSAYPLKCSWANLKSCRPSSILSSPYWEPIAARLRSKWAAAFPQSPGETNKPEKG